LLRTPMLSECESLVRICDTSMQTELETIRYISQICTRKKITHNIIIMVETDDKREGINPKEVIAFFDEVYKNYKNIKIIGLGTNARCLSKRKPTLKSIEYLIKIRDKINEIYDYKIPIISGGNSSLWKYIEAGIIPKEVNQVRIGEAIFIGNETSNYEKIIGAHEDCFKLETEVIEVKEKNGKIYKAIIALGLQDAGYKHIKIENPFYEIIGQSSDHTVLGLKKQYYNYNITDISGNLVNIDSSDNSDNLNLISSVNLQNGFKGNLNLIDDKHIIKNSESENEYLKMELKVGDIVKFKLDYFGLLSCMTSPFIVKKYV